MEIEVYLKTIEAIVSGSYQHRKCFEIDLVNVASEYNRLKKSFDQITKPSLYWFEADSFNNADLLITSFNSSVNQFVENRRSYPKRNNNQNSSVLYLGVRQGGANKNGDSNFAGRMYHHFGLYKYGTTQGLQLEYWAKENNQKLKLNVLEFDFKENHIQYLYIIEKLFSIELRPLLGRH